MECLNQNDTNVTLFETRVTLANVLFPPGILEFQQQTEKRLKLFNAKWWLLKIFQTMWHSDWMNSKCFLLGQLFGVSHVIAHFYINVSVLIMLLDDSKTTNVADKDVCVACKVHWCNLSWIQGKRVLIMFKVEINTNIFFMLECKKKKKKGAYSKKYIFCSNAEIRNIMWIFF